MPGFPGGRFETGMIGEMDVAVDDFHTDFLTNQEYGIQYKSLCPEINSPWAEESPIRLSPVFWAENTFFLFFGP